MESFSASIKQEIATINNLKNKNLVRAELIGYFLTISSNKFITESEYNINRFAKLLSNIDVNNYTIEMQGKKFCIKLKNINKIFGSLEIDDNNEEEVKAMTRGAFLGGGTITNPSNVYHLQLNLQNEKDAEFLKLTLKKYDINVKSGESKATPILYIKEGEMISSFLAFIGANKSVLEFEDTRVIKDVRNNVNRLVNCETANINKTITSSVKQIEDIKLIKEKHKFDKLSE